ncbi:MAG: LLM class flavin-dependent oxidoreductase, partial [Acidobacteria bacterium]|nr:LLM class flavin-dependent oxidoreductase [Acidobacteriota bacterium]
PRIELPGLVLSSVDVPAGTSPFDLIVSLAEQRGALVGSLKYRRDLFDAATVERWGRAFGVLLAALAEDVSPSLGALPLLGEAELHQLVHASNRTARAIPAVDERVSRRFAETSRARADETALIAGDESLSYRELARRVGRLSHRLRVAGIGPETCVGVCLERSADLVVALLAVLDTGAAYLPLDPDYPRERLAFMLEDSGARALVARGDHADLGAALPQVFDPDDETADAGIGPDARPSAVAGPAEALAYLIYTSGSTGRPKGVMVPHGTLSAFLAAMDERLGDEPIVWLAVTSVSFDISVLEILWTLSRGHTVVLGGVAARPAAGAAAALPAVAPQSRDLSLAYFASQAGNETDPYRLLLEGARFADQRDFRAVWTPERHFHAFGGPFPNPALTSALIAGVTERIEIRAGSVVLPLTSPTRVAEDWALLDIVSRGRVGIAFASGWHANDFVLAPDRYPRRKQLVREGIEQVRALWRGERIALTNGLGETVRVATLPRPVQAELPVWLTSSGNPETFALAGELGTGVLTHLLGQDTSGLRDKVALYREALARHHPGQPGHVTVMVHTFVADDLTPARDALRRYLRSSADLIASLVEPAAALGAEEAAELDRSLEVQVGRYLGGGSLIGDLEQGRQVLEGLSAAGADEVACLIDFGVDTDGALAALEPLDALRRIWQGEAPARVPGAAVREHRAATLTTSIAEAIRRHGVSHLQCTPSLARMLTLDADARPALGQLRALLVGGEALATDLARDLLSSLSGRLLNMYGPTETTVWSSCHEVTTTEPSVPIGRPVANTTVHLLDRSLRPVLVGSPGELMIGGAGVVRGYHRRPALTAERFLPDPFAERPGARLYRTGDLGHRRADGVLLFDGRADQQVKIRGHRIEPGEIETRLTRRAEVREAAVLPVAGSAGETRLVAFVVPARRPPLTPIADGERRSELLAGRLQVRLPNGMIVTHLSDFQANNMYREIFEGRTYLRHGVVLADGASVFDVGANVGLFSLFVHSVSHGARVVAFEPMPATHAALATNVALYGLDVALYERGVSDQPGEAEFTFYPHMPGMSSRFADPEEDKRETASLIQTWLREQAPDSARAVLDRQQLSEYLDEQFESRQVRRSLVTLSDVIRERGVERIDLLKVDVERSEMLVFRGLEDRHWPRVRQVVAEVHGDDLRDECRAHLEARGFEVAIDDHVVVKDDQPSPVRVYMLYARRPEDGGIASAAEPSTEDLAPELDVATLRESLEDELPEAMVPARFVELEELPRTPNGKLDRRALARLAETPAGDRAGAGDVPYAPPDSETERVIATVFGELLGLSSVSIDDNFFDLGGNSVLIVEANSRLRSALGRSISVIKMFRHPTVRSLARHLADEARDAPAVDESRARAHARLASLRRRSGRGTEPTAKDLAE